MKNKNPLYVIKGQDVHEASSVLDLMIKKFNLGAVYVVMKNIFFLLLELVENFAMYQAVKKIIDDYIEKFKQMAVKLGVLTI